MKIKNFATFGLFVDGDMTDSGSIHAMENTERTGGSRTHIRL